MATIKTKKPHILAVPHPAQGHVKPLMKLCCLIAKQGIKVTFVNIQHIHEKLLCSSKVSDSDDKNNDDKLVLTSIPNGADPDDPFKLLESLRESMPGFLADKINTINSENVDEKVSCVIFDITISWLSETVKKMGAEPIVFSPPSAAVLVLGRNIPNLVQGGYLDSNGCITNDETITLSEEIPPWRSQELPWSTTNLNLKKIIFDCAPSSTTNTIKEEAKWVLVNSFYELEHGACDLHPNILPIGPFLESNIHNNTCTSFHLEDDTCLTWLDTKQPGSVVYVSFGSLAVFSQHQLDELALGLELSGRNFLWVVRSNTANGSQVVYPDGFLDRINSSGVGKIVEWAPQEKVLNHRSIACFVSHCGWNSTLEGSSLGVPYLCWPYFADQFHNQSYICDKWENGLRIEPDENGIRPRNEIKRKIDMMFSSEKFKRNALKIKDLAAKSLSKGGTSYNNFETFINYLCSG